MSKRVWTSIRNAVYAVSIMMVVLSSFMFGEIVGQYKEEGQDYMDFIIERYEIEASVHEGINQYDTQRLQSYKNVQTVVRIAVFLNFLLVAIDFKIDPENHWINDIRKKIKGLRAKLEDS